jgi:nucleoside-diphosphate-sugar epimerase
MRPLWDLFLRRRLPFVPSETAFCWGHVDDTARAHVLAMERGRSGENYIIAGPPHTLADAFAIASRITGIPAPRPMPAVLLRGAAALLERIGADAEALRVLGGATYLGTSAKAHTELGFSARPLEQGLREILTDAAARTADLQRPVPPAR